MRILNPTLIVVACLIILHSWTGQAKAQPNSPQVDVMTFNIRYGTARDGENAWPNRREMLINLIRRHDPDILGLQEALRFQIDEIRESLPHYAEIGVGRDDGKTRGEYSCILYRPDRFTVTNVDTFWFSETPTVPASKSWGNGIPRICTNARFTDTHDGGTAFDVYNLHLDHQSQPSRDKSVDYLQTVIDERSTNHPVIVMGDFNAAEDNSAILSITGRLEHTESDRPLRDSFRILHPEETMVGTFNGFIGQTDRGKIDHVFVSREVTVHEAAIVFDHDQETGRWPSDHCPVIATVSFAEKKTNQTSTP